MADITLLQLGIICMVFMGAALCIALGEFDK